MPKRPKTPPKPLDLPLNIRVVYDAKTGQIVHTHYVVILPHAHAPSEKQLDADALNLASKHSKRSANYIKVLRVKSEEFKPGLVYHVALDGGRPALRAVTSPESKAT